MSSDKSCLLVVDASVIHAAGEKDHPVSKSCRETLLDIKKVCHHIVMTPAIQAEWKEHASRFAYKWWRSMVACRKVKMVQDTHFKLPPTDITCLNTEENTSLQKDAHLLEGAFEGDGIIISLDDNAAKIWDKCHKHIQLPKAIKWISPFQWSNFHS